MEQQKTLVELRGVSKSFDGDIALDNVDISIRDKEFLTILGPSGCGKTTILRLIGGFETPDSGSVKIGGEVVNDLPPEKRAVNTVFQSYALFPHMTVFDNVAFGLKMQKVPAGEIRSRVEDALKLVEMERFGGRKPQELSGGQQQRVAIARALVNKPLVLLLDESFSALDRRLRKQMQMDIKHLQRELGITFVLVTHDQEEAFTMADRIVVMNHGRVEQIGNPRQVYEEPENLFVARFVGETNFFDAVVRKCIPNGDGFRIEADLGGMNCFLSAGREFASGDKVRVLLRPEDLQLSDCLQYEYEQGCPVFKGSVLETVYKGTTYDVVVELENGNTVLATEFFNEDAESVSYRPGDELAVSWIEGWEVVLPYEEQKGL
ncbi:spermidine/putrescine ABC transporter ATP-binding protein PotA [Maridesulfovibrio sp.]|uniref:spermidine/putrescine ABC transporter ATP-binding protein PotA n=1 Tax=Maridesulfovibrio sp. TaxID=2795000 RepID=UPI0029CA37D1|nr:spermidine/putrescine ABC transporter ATP-binding protein PotA [Maridesulfovibrio sp.]